MSRFVSVLLFVIVFLTVCLYPSVQTAADISMPLAGDAFGQTAQSKDEVNLADSEQKYVMATPTPTPTPSPTPTPVPTPKPTPTPPPITKGTSGDDVAAVQRRLVELGFMADAVDGAYGNATEKAVKNLIEYLNMIGFTGAAEEMQDTGIAPAEGTEATPQSPAKRAVDGSFVDHELFKILMDEDFPIYKDSLTRGDQGLDAYRLQRRLNALKYIYKGVDGVVGVNTLEAVKEFQRNNGLQQTGIADRATLDVLFSGDAVESTKPLHPYKLIVDVSEQRVRVYEWNDDKQDYTKKIHEFKCSTGKKSSPTPLGTYQASTGPAARWHYFTKFGCWAQYAFSIEGDVLFHSVLYSQKNEKSLTKTSVNNLGRAVSHGCVRLAVKDAKWIWENCPFGTTVVVQK